MFRKILEQIKYNNNSIHDTDSKLIWMGLKQHLRDPDNFKRLLKTGKINNFDYNHFGVRIQDLPINKSLKRKYSKSSIFLGKTDSVNEAEYRQTPNSKRDIVKNRQHFILLNRIHEPDPNDHIEVTHRKFLDSLNNHYGAFRHEFQHLVDYHGKAIEQDPEYDDQSDPTGYYNSKRELSAFTAQKRHEIERIFLRNNKSISQTGSYTELPIRHRLYHYRNNNFRDKLAIISDHGLDSEERTIPDWYDKLTPENKKKVEETIHPLINKYTIVNKPKVVY